MHATPDTRTPVGRRTFLAAAVSFCAATQIPSVVDCVSASGFFPASLVQAARSLVEGGTLGKLTRISAGVPDAVVTRAASARHRAASSPALDTMRLFLNDAGEMAGPRVPSRVSVAGGACRASGLRQPDSFLLSGELDNGLVMLLATGKLDTDDAFISVRGDCAELLLKRGSLTCIENATGSAKVIAIESHPMPNAPVSAKACEAAETTIAMAYTAWQQSLARVI